MSWASFIGAGIGPWVKKGLAALGVGVITYGGFQALQGQVASAVQGALGQLGGAVYQILALAGFIDAVGIWVGALAAAVALLSLKRLGVLTG